MDIVNISLKNKIHHYFLPHESNNYKARTLHVTVFIYYIALLLLFQTSAGIIRHAVPNILGYATSITVEQTLALVNKKRAETGLSPLQLSFELSTAATQKAADMFTKDYWAHVSPTGATPWQFINGAGYQYTYAGENLAKSFDTSEDVVEAWMNSPSHRANLLKPEYTDIGLAVMNGKLRGEETTLVVQEFGAKIASSQPAQSKEPSVKSAPVVPDSHPANLQAVKSESTLPATSFPRFNFHLSKTLSLILAEFLLIVLFLDSIYIWKHKIFRISSHSLAHIIFLTALIGAMTATGVGVIL